MTGSLGEGHVYPVLHCKVTSLPFPCSVYSKRAAESSPYSSGEWLSSTSKGEHNPILCWLFCCSGYSSFGRWVLFPLAGCSFNPNVHSDVFLPKSMKQKISRSEVLPPISTTNFCVALVRSWLVSLFLHLYSKVTPSASLHLCSGCKAKVGW